jgi:hypothetical protein
MTVTAFSGPIVQFGITLSSTSGDGLTGQDYEHNPQRAPTYADLGDAMLDPRSAYQYDPGGTLSNLVYGLYNNVGTVDYIPVAASSIALVNNTASSGTTTFTLTAASSANGTYSTTIIAPETGKNTGTLIAIDSTASYLTFGSSANQFVLWNPGAGGGRNVVVRPSSNGDAGNFTVIGRDMYGYKMTEFLPGGTTTITGKKAFKFISSIVNATTPTSTGVAIGLGDVYGLPLYTPYAGLNVTVVKSTSVTNPTIITLSTANFVIGSSAATQTSTTPDVRGTFTSTTAADGTTRLQIVITPAASAIAAITSTNFAPLFGAAQFSSV